MTPQCAVQPAPGSPSYRPAGPEHRVHRVLSVETGNIGPAQQLGAIRRDPAAEIAGRIAATLRAVRVALTPAPGQDFALDSDTPISHIQNAPRSLGTAIRSWEHHEICDKAMKTMEAALTKPGGPITVCVINLKGGVGKSTISALLARRGFTDRGLDVLAIDIDPQANLSQGLMHRGYAQFIAQQEPSIVEVFSGYLPPSRGNKIPTPLVAAKATQTIAVTENRSLELIASRFDFSDNLLGAVRPDPRSLARFLSDNFHHKDLIIIDCAPTESILTTAAYHSSGHVLVPVKPEFFATIGFPLLQQSLNAFRRQNRAHHISVAGVVINNAFYHGGNDGGPEKARAMQEISTEAQKNGWPIYKNELLHSRGYPKIMRGDNLYSGNAQYFARFANEFFRSLGL